jgi:hypothetical protein
MPTSNYTLRFATTPLRLCACDYTLAELAYQSLAPNDRLVHSLLKEAHR